MRDYVQTAAFRIAALYSLTFLVMAALLGSVIYRSMRAELRAELGQRIVVERNSLLREGRGDPRALASAVSARTDHGVGDMFFAVVTRDGTLLAGTKPASVPVIGWSDGRFLDAHGKYDDAHVLATRLTDGGMLVVGADPESVEQLDQRMLPLLGLAFGLMALMGMGGGFLLSAVLRRRVDAITATAEAIIDGDLGQRMTVSGSDDEFDRLSSTLNRMLDRIGALMTNLQQVSGDIAHDLRTPLSRLRQKLELASLDKPGDETLHGAVADAGELLEMFGAILSISEVEAGGAALRTSRLELSAIVGDLCESFGPSIEDSGRSLTRSIAPDIAIDGQRELIAQLLVNLLDNALRHTPEGSRIAVSLYADGDRAVLSVADNGPGIPPQDRARVFERFVRLEHSRTTPGHGLGLRLAAAIATAHQAVITLEDNQPGVKMMISIARCAA